MKKTLITCALAGLLLAACGDDKKDSTSTPDTTAAASTTAAPGTTDGEATTAAACAEGKTLEAGSLTPRHRRPCLPALHDRRRPHQR